MKTQLKSLIFLALIATSAAAKILNDGTKLGYGKAFENKVRWRGKSIILIRSGSQGPEISQNLPKGALGGKAGHVCQPRHQ